MSMIEDEALAIYSAAKQQQAAIDQAIVAMNKASADITGRYVEFLAALDQVRNMPEAAIIPLKRAVVGAVESGLSAHLEPKTKGLGEAANAATARIDEIKDRGLLPTILLSLMSGFVGAGLAIGAQWALAPAPAAPVAAAPQFALPMTAEAPPKKKRH